LNNVLGAGVPVVDVSFTPDPPLSLDHVAKKSGACCVVDCGIAPGLSHILVGAAHAELGGLDSAKIWVGGMPQAPPPVFRHAIYFNPHDLMAEYVRPARARTAGKDVNPNPLQAPVESWFDAELGQLEAFISDGLRSLLGSYPDVGEMAELTLRWPGHLETMRNLSELGLIDSSQASVELAKVLAERFDGERFPDVLVMMVEVTKGEKQRAWRLIDRRTDNQSAMARTTGFTTAAVAMALAKRQFSQPGVYPPERLGKEPGLAKLIVEDLVARGIKISEVPQAALAAKTC
jgi:saccharopine dehydrogenase-like NADP-dependent oxidoreductase